MTGRNNSSSNGWSGLASVFLGPLVAAVFYGVLYVSPVPMMHRYFMGHPVAYAATILFFIAFVGLAVRYAQTLRQLSIVGGLSNADLQPAAQTDDLNRNISRWIDHLRELRGVQRSSVLVNRLDDLLKRQQRRKTTRFLNDDLRDVSDREADQSHDSLQLVRIIVWAIPMLGFLGTVVGITQTLGNLDFTDATNAVDKLKAGLYVAFDTTALGLVLSVVAIFLQFPVEKKMTQLLTIVDQRTIELLSGALPEESASDEPLHAIAEMNRAVLASVNQLVETQAELWRKTVDSAHEHWTMVVGNAGDQVQSALTEAIELTLRSHGEHVERTHQLAAAQIEQRWHQWQTVLSENARLLTTQQQTLAEQNELLIGAGERSKELAEVRQLLQTNTAGLTSMPEMCDAMRSLARAIDLLVDRVPTQTTRGKAA
ncbi:MAG: MotA/TolQ/ExbB proton channel family protein [Pirellulaceae bacterium]